MWYLYLLIGLYLLLPLYRKIAKYSNEEDLKYLLGIYVLFLSIFPLFQVLGLDVGFYIHVSTIYPFYLFCGYAIHRKILRTPIWMTWIMVIVSTLGIIFMTYVRWKYNIEELEHIWSYSSILVVMQAIGIFTVIEKIVLSENGWIHKVFIQIDKCSFGIYLIHMMLVRYILRYRMINPYETRYPAISFVLIFIVVFAVSYAVTWMLRHIPGLRKII